MLKSILKIINIFGIDHKVIYSALESEINDFEDAVQSIAADMSNLDYIITRNIIDFEKSKIKAVNPEQFLTIILK